MDIKKWWKAAGVRAVKTAAQTAVVAIPVGVGIHEVGWLGIISMALGAGVLSLLTSVAGIPEVDDGTSLPEIYKEDK